MISTEPAGRRSIPSMQSMVWMVLMASPPVPIFSSATLDHLVIRGPPKKRWMDGVFVPARRSLALIRIVPAVSSRVNPGILSPPFEADMDEIMAEICESGEVLRLVPKAPSTGLLAASSAVAR